LPFEADDLAGTGLAVVLVLAVGVSFTLAYALFRRDDFTAGFAATSRTAEGSAALEHGASLACTSVAHAANGAGISMVASGSLGR
jgi:hypothetical protein